MKFSLPYLLLFAVVVHAQQPAVRRYTSQINHPSYNTYAPYISADANAMVFLSDDAEDQILTPFYSFQEDGNWKTPSMFPKSIMTRFNFLRGYALSANGRRLYYTTARMPTIGGYDIMMSDWQGTQWSEPSNLMSPVNSRENEGAPSVSVDGKMLFFMRCGYMDANKSSNCRILMSIRKSNGQWDTPVELPPSINNGNAQTPRILADGETLIFSSDKISPNKGGMDLYMTKFVNGTWSTPEPLDFANTEKDDQWVSVSGLGRYLLRDLPGARKNEITEVFFPLNKRPKTVMRIEGKILGADGAPAKAYYGLFDLKTGKRIANGQPGADGSFMVYAIEGSMYQLQVDPEQESLTYFTKIFDLTKDVRAWEKINPVLRPLTAGDSFELTTFMVDPGTGKFDERLAAGELKSLKRLIEGYPQQSFGLQLEMTGYREDVNQQPDLTEIKTTVATQKFSFTDSTGAVVERDSFVTVNIYHNDTTAKRIEEVNAMLAGSGIPLSRLELTAVPVPGNEPRRFRLIVTMK